MEVGAKDVQGSWESSDGIQVETVGKPGSSR